MDDVADSEERDTGAGPETLKRPGALGVGSPRPPVAPAAPGRHGSSAPPRRPGVPA